MTRDCRFIFDREGEDVLIEEPRGPSAVGPREDYTVKRDAILSRLIDSKSGGVVVVGAGLANDGTHMGVV